MDAHRDPYLGLDRVVGGVEKMFDAQVLFDLLGSREAAPWRFRSKLKKTGATILSVKRILLVAAGRPTLTLCEPCGLNNANHIRAALRTAPEQSQVFILDGIVAGGFDGR